MKRTSLALKLRSRRRWRRGNFLEARLSHCTRSGGSPCAPLPFSIVARATAPLRGIPLIPIEPAPRTGWSGSRRTVDKAQLRAGYRVCQPSWAATRKSSRKIHVNRRPKWKCFLGNWLPCSSLPTFIYFFNAKNAPAKKSQAPAASVSLNANLVKNWPGCHLSTLHILELSLFPPRMMTGLSQLARMLILFVTMISVYDTNEPMNTRFWLEGCPCRQEPA